MCQCISRQSKTYRRNLLGKINVLGQVDGTLLQRALKVDILQVLAEVGLLVDDADQTVLDLKVNLGTLFNVLRQDTGCLDREGDATAMRDKLEKRTEHQVIPRLTRKEGWGKDRLSQSREGCPWERRRRAEGCHQERGTLLRARVARCP